jgi:hypothetical protein
MTIKLLIFFDLASDLVNFSPYKHMPFLVWSLVFDFFNQVPDYPLNFNIFTIKSLIHPINPPKTPMKSPNFNLFHLTPKLTPKIDFPYNQVLCKIN